MSLNKILNSLPIQLQKEVKFIAYANLTNYTTLKLKDHAPLIIVKSIDVLKEILHLLYLKQIKYFVLGKGANSVCLTQNKFPLILLNFTYNKETLKQYKTSYILPASISISTLTNMAIKLNLSGWEVLSGIPATLGGAIAMNAGTKFGSIAPLIKRVWVLDKHGNERIEVITSNSFAYRTNNFLTSGDIIVQAEIVHNGKQANISTQIKKYLQERQINQPLNMATCGCTFKNYQYNDITYSAGKFLDMMGLTGLSYKGLKISHRHANFIEHSGEATAEDFINFTHYIKNFIKLNYGLNFEFEYSILGK